MVEVIGTFFTAWLLADFLTGVFHWFEDRYIRTDWPILGKYVAVPNELHHTDPRAFLNQGYFGRNWTTLLPSALAFAGCYALGSPLVVLLALVFVSQGNEVHAWSHSKGIVSPLVRSLQETGMLQSPRQHSEHHRSEFDVRYCVLSDMLNPLLDLFGFWGWIEYGLARLGLKVK